MSSRENYAFYFVFILIFVVAGCQRAPSDVTTTNKEVVRQWFSALDAQDYDALTSLMDEQFVVPARIIDGADRAVGRDATFEVIRGYYRSFPDYTHDIEEMIAEGDRVAVIWKLHHCMADGISGLDVMNVLVGPDPDYVPRPAVKWTPREPPSGSQMVLDEVVRRVTGPLGILGGCTPGATLPHTSHRPQNTPHKTTRQFIKPTQEYTH